MSREAVLDLLEGAARWLDGLADAGGVRRCPEHGVEHLGKTAYRVHLGLALARERGAPLDEVRRTALRLARACRKYPHPEARAHLFFERWPDPWNCSNHLIDSGAACDALGRVLLEAPELLAGEERELVAGALARSASTYLWAASLDKPVPAQCLWGAVGMARASAALRRADLAERAREAVLRAYDNLRDDGSWSYYTDVGPGAGEPGSEDASAFYHSRCVGFALEALLALGDDPRAEPHGPRLRAALDFLLALHRADGRKSRAWEAKLWYFDGPTETASCSFDVHALLLGERVFGGGRYAARAARSLALLLAARAPDGSVGSGAPRAFQCRAFWTAHVGLLGSVLDELPEASAAQAPCEPERALFPDAGLARLARGGRVVLVRGARPRRSPGFGGIAGGGSRVADGRGAPGDHARDERAALAPDVAGELWAPAALPRLPLRPGGRRWLSFSRWRWRVALRARGPLAAARLALRTLGELAAWQGAAAASHFAADCALALDGDEVVARASLAAVDGAPLAGTRTTRRYRLEGDGLHVGELLECDGALELVRYRLPPGAVDVRVDECAESAPVIERRGVKRLSIRYRLP